MTGRYLFWDLETFSAGREYDMPPEEFVRIMHYAWDDGPVLSTTDVEEMRELVRAARFIVGHNIISADLTWLFGMDSLEPLYLSLQDRVIDTFYLANLLTPAPYSYTDSKGHTYRDAAKPENAMKWLSLENLCFQFGLPGKFGNLKEIAKKYNPPKTPVADLEFGLIPLDDPEFLEYAEQDVVAVRGLFKYLLDEIKRQDYPGDYIWREMKVMSATAGQMHRNGILVNQEYANQRIAEQTEVRERIMSWLIEEFDMPTGSKQPWKSNAGKGAILKAFESFGIVPEGNETWKRSAKTNAPSFSGETLIAISEGTPAEELGQALATLQGQRSLAQLVKDSMKSDGRVHPDITSLQRSGRWSFTKPGVTIFGERSEALKADKALFTAAPGKVLAGFDYSSADARAMAALSGDEEFARRFETDEDGNDLYDGHNLTGEAMFGKDVYYARMNEKGKPTLRDVAKMGGHAQNYNIGAYKLANSLNDASKKQGLGLTFWAPNPRGQKPIPKYPDSISTPDMIQAFNQTYVYLKHFKDQAVEEGKKGYVTNSWGRRMTVDEGREFTQAPALHGQSVTREMMADAILRLCERGEYYIRALRAIIHDELLLEFDEDRIEEDIKVVKECMEADFDPGTPLSIVIPFPVGHGYGKTWKDAGH